MANPNQDRLKTLLSTMAQAIKELQENGPGGGEGGTGAPGQDGREVEFRVADGYIQWHYVGDAEWQNLIALSELQGPQGEPGQDGQSDIFTINTEDNALEITDEDGNIILAITNDGTLKAGTFDSSQIPQGAGETGPQGPVGDKGPDGDKGETGDKGPDGDPGVIIDNLTKEDIMALGIPGIDEPSQGNAYEVSDEEGNIVLAVTEGGHLKTKEFDSENISQETPKEIELDTSLTHIQWRYVGDSTWNDLVSLADLKGADGSDGNPGADGADGSPGADGVDGEDGREVEFKKSTTHIQWKYTDEEEWTDLVSLSELKGDAGTGVYSSVNLGYRSNNGNVSISNIDTYKEIKAKVVWSSGDGTVSDYNSNTMWHSFTPDDVQYILGSAEPFTVAATDRKVSLIIFPTIDTSTTITKIIISTNEEKTLLTISGSSSDINVTFYGINY